MKWWIYSTSVSFGVSVSEFCPLRLGSFIPHEENLMSNIKFTCLVLLGFFYIVIINILSYNRRHDFWRSCCYLQVISGRNHTVSWYVTQWRRKCTFIFCGSEHNKYAQPHGRVAAMFPTIFVALYQSWEVWRKLEDCTISWLFLLCSSRGNNSGKGGGAIASLFRRL